MSGIIHVSRSVAGSMLTQLNNALNASGAGKIELYTGTMPASPETGITSQVLLGTNNLANPAAVQSGGTLTFTTPTTDSSADATGTVTWARFKDGAGTAICDWDVGVTGSGAMIQMVTTSIVVGGPIAWNSLTLTLP